MEERLLSHRLAGKAILITGAAAGIGRATAIRLAAEGATLALADRDADGLSACEVSGGAHRIVYDAADAEGSMRMVEEAVAALGTLDGVCNIAGVYAKAHLTQTPAADWQRILQINLTSVFHIMQRAVPHLVRTRGAIVNTASIAALDGLAYSAAYAVSKAGVIALTQSAAAEFAQAGVRVNAVAPGGVRTSMGGSSPLPDADPDLTLSRSKLPDLDGFGAPEDLAAAYAYLVSGDARYVSGTVLTVDGAQRLM